MFPSRGDRVEMLQFLLIARICRLELAPVAMATPLFPQPYARRDAPAAIVNFTGPKAACHSSESYRAPLPALRNPFASLAFPCTAAPSGGGWLRGWSRVGLLMLEILGRTCWTRYSIVEDPTGCCSGISCSLPLRLPGYMYLQALACALAIWMPDIRSGCQRHEVAQVARLYYP